MSELIKTKLRNIGTSFGVIIPLRVVKEEGLKNGEEIEITISKKNPKLLEQAFGSAKGAKFKFERDRRERI